MMIGAGSISRSFVRVVAVVPMLASLTVIGAASGVGPGVAGCAQASSLHHAALVVEHGDAAVVTACVSFSEDSITGEQLLARSRVEYATADYGGAGQAVCQVDGEPVQYPASCWSASSSYWAMYVSRNDGSWTFSTLGVSSQTFRDGDAEGFRYEGQSASVFPASPRGVCPVATPATPAPTAVTTPAPVPRRVPAHATTPASGQPSRAPVAISAAGLSPSAGESPTAPPSDGATPRATIVTLGATPPSRPPSPSFGAWAAGALGTVLTALLVIRVVRSRRRWRRGREPGGIARP